MQVSRDVFPTHRRPKYYFEAERVSSFPDEHEFRIFRPTFYPIVANENTRIRGKKGIRKESVVSIMGNTMEEQTRQFRTYGRLDYFRTENTSQLLIKSYDFCSYVNLFV